MKKYPVGIMFCLVAFYFNAVSAETAKITIYEDRTQGGEQQLMSEVFWTLGGGKYLYFEFKERTRKDPPVLKSGKYSPVEFLKIVYPEAMVQENKNGIVVIEEQTNDRDYPLTKEIDVPKTNDIVSWICRNAMPMCRVDLSTMPEKIPFDGGKTTMRDLLIYAADKQTKFKICEVIPKNEYQMKSQRENVNFKNIPQGQLYWAAFSDPYNNGLTFSVAPPLDGLKLLKVSVEVSVNEKESDKDNFFVNLPVTIENISGQELFFKDFQKNGIRISNRLDFSKKTLQNYKTSCLSFSGDINDRKVEFKEPAPDSFSLKPGQKTIILLRERRDLTKPELRAFKEKNEDPNRKRAVCFGELYNAVVYFYDSEGVEYLSHAEKNVEFANTYYVERNQQSLMYEKSAKEKMAKRIPVPEGMIRISPRHGYDSYDILEKVRRATGKKYLYAEVEDKSVVGYASYDAPEMIPAKDYSLPELLNTVFKDAKVEDVEGGGMIVTTDFEKKDTAYPLLRGGARGRTPTIYL